MLYIYIAQHINYFLNYHYSYLMSTSLKSVLNIHSANRTYGQPNNFTLTLGSNVPAPKSISLLSAEIPNTLTNIHQYNAKLTLQLVTNNGNEVIKMRNNQTMLRFKVYSATGTYEPSVLFQINTFEQWLDFFNNTANNRDCTFAYSTGGLPLTKKTPLASISITYNTLDIYEDINTTLSNLRTLIVQQLSGNVDITADMLLAFRFLFDSTSRRFLLYFNTPKIVVEVDTTGTLNPVFGFANAVVNGIYLPSTSVSKNFMYSILPDQKNYDGATLATEVQTKLRSAVTSAGDTTWLSSSSFTVTYSNVEHKITLQANKLSGGNSVLATDLKISIDYADSELDELIGIKNTQSPANPLTGEAVLELLGTNTLYIWSDKASSFNIDSSGASTWVMQKVQIDKPFGEVVFYKSYNPDLERFNLDPAGSNFSQITLSLRDWQGNILPYNSEWSCSLLLYY
jgi:hypothetical protein